MYKPSGRAIGIALLMVAIAVILLINAPSLAIARPSQMPAPDPGWPADSNPCHIPCGTLTDTSIRNLISLMTVSEEDTLAHLGGPNVNGNAGSVAPISRLGIPAFRWTDGPAGVRLGQVETAMPAPVGLTASWDPTKAYLYGQTVGLDARATTQDGWYAPMMNQIRIPTAGRNFETLGEDPYLMSQLAVQEVTGAQGVGFVTEIKHFVDNDFENGRTSTSVYVDERTLREGEMLAFEASVNAGARAVMCAYNRLNIFVTPPALGQGDIYSCSNDYTLNYVLKGREPFSYTQLPVPPAFGFKGNVGSDYGATHRPSDLIYGLDTEQPSTTNLGNPVINAIGTCSAGNAKPCNGPGTAAIALSADLPAVPAYIAGNWKDALDNAAFYALKMYNDAGLLEGTPYGSMHTAGCVPPSPSGCVAVTPPRPDKASLQAASLNSAQMIAEASATLLKNDNSLLPLTCADFTGGGVLLSGPTSIATYTGGGGSAHVIPYDPVKSTYEALMAAATAKCGGSPVINYTPGYDLDGPIMPSSVITAANTVDHYPNWTVPGGSGDPTNTTTNGLLRQQVVTSTVAVSGTQPTLVDPTGNSDQVDATVNYIPSGLGTLPVNTAWRWTGMFTAPSTPVTGSYQIKIFVANQRSAQLYVDGLQTGQRRINIGAYPFTTAITATTSWATLGETSKSHDLNFQYAQQAAYTVILNAGQKLHLDLRVATGATTPTRVQLRWVPTTNQSDSIAAATTAATTANKVVDFVYDEGSEGSDRGGNAIANGLATPGYQDAVVSAFVGANPNTIVLLTTGDSVFMPWASSVNSILEMWYPGSRGAEATANVLLGNVNPGGKLPETFYDRNAPVGQRFPQDTQPAACENNTANYGTSGGSVSSPTTQGQCPMYPGIYLPNNLSDGVTGNRHGFRAINFSDQSLGGVPGNGIFIGYRWFDKNGYTPLFPFGHGLSYTTFGYSDLNVALAGDGVDVSFNVQNTGAVAGDEVPQVYIGAPSAPPVPMAVKALAAFDRITLNPGETKSVTLHIGARELSYWSTVTHDWALVLGDRPIYVGSSSRDIRLTGSMTSITLPTSVQYSDPLKAVVSPATINGNPVSGSVEFFVNGVSVGSAPVDATGTAIVVPAPLLAPGSYNLTAKFTSTSPSFTDSSAGPVTLTVTQEDARAFYNGNGLFWTSSVNSTSANVTLSAAILDITAVDPTLSPPNPDTYPGDIRTATVTFINRDTNTAFPGCTNLSVGLVNAGDTKTGTASCTTTLATDNTGATQYTVGIVVSGYYTRNSSDDDTIITVAQPIPSNFITGGGYLVLSNSAGLVPGTVGSNTNFGFNVKYNKGGTNLQGHVNIIVRSGGHTYQIKSNALTSLGVNNNQANFTSKANIQDITDPLNVISLDGNATLQLWMTDNGDPGTSDTLAIQVLNKSGGMWFSSNWNGTKTVEQTLGGGNLAVH